MTEDRYRFSRQEERVLSLALTGLSDADIATKLDVGLGTIRTFWKRIRAKAGGGTRAEVLAKLGSLALPLDEDSAPNGQIGALVRKQEAEAEANRTLLVLDALLASSNGRVWVLTAQGEVVRSNSAGVPLDCFIDATEASSFQDGVRGHVSFELNCRLRAADGSARPHKLKATAVLENGRAVRWVITATCEERRSEAQPIVTSAFQRARTGLGVVDPSGKILIANDRLGNILGREREDLKGRSVLELTTFSDRKRLEATMLRADKEGAAQCNVGMLHREGGHVPVLMDFATVKEGDAVSHRVITARRMADAAQLLGPRTGRI